MDFSTFFNQFNSEDSIFILLFMLIAFFFGLLVGYILRSRRVMALRRELKDKKKELDEKQATIEALKEELALKEADVKRAGFAVQEAEARAERIEEEKANLHKQIYEVNQELESHKATNKAYEATIAKLQQQLSQTEASNQELSTTIEQDGDDANELAEMQSVYNATRSRLLALEERMDTLARENEELRESIEGVSSQQTVIPSSEVPMSSSPSVRERGIPSVHPMPGLPDAELVEEEPDTIFMQDKPILDDKIRLDEQKKDDLSRIDGIGPFLENKLNEVGIFTYEEISTWDSNRIAAITEAIGHFKGRIEKDDWVGQAAQLALEKQENPEAFKKDNASALSDDPKDLKVVEGIGPKIEEVLKQAGINDWAALAETEATRLREILDQAGPRFKMHDPETWPAQARLAETGEWTILKEYQDELVGGRDMGGE